MDITVDREGIAKTKIKVLVRFETRARIIYPVIISHLNVLSKLAYCAIPILWGAIVFLL